MTNLELSAQFDVLFNNVTSNQAPGMNEYEKSVFLTKAQSQLIREYFNNRTDGAGGGFDGSQKRQYDFSSLIKTQELSADSAQLDKTLPRIDKRSIRYIFPDDYFLSVNEAISDRKYQYSVIPITYPEYTRLMMKPYAYPVKRAAWRLISGSTERTYTNECEEHSDKPTTLNIPVVELIGKFYLDKEAYLSEKLEEAIKAWKEEHSGEEISDEEVKKIRDGLKGKDTDENVRDSQVTYVIRYIKKPKPIILDDLSGYGEELTIDNCVGPSECELPSETHEEILERAVTLAKIAWQGGTITQAAAQQQKNND